MEEVLGFAIMAYSFVSMVLFYRKVKRNPYWANPLLSAIFALNPFTTFFLAPWLIILWSEVRGFLFKYYVGYIGLLILFGIFIRFGH